MSLADLSTPAGKSILSSRTPVFEFVTDLCKTLRAAGKTISGEELAKALNEAGHKTSYGTPYVEQEAYRGPFVVSRSTWKWLTDQGRHSEAEDVAQAVVNSLGKPPWAD